MTKAKFWIMQIVMVTIISLVFGGAAFAGPSDNAIDKRQGAQSDNASAQGQSKANSNANGFVADSASGTGETGTDEGSGGDEPTCVPDPMTQCP